jgi:hypothetical protein
MNNYVPFLKLKVNEVGALSVLSSEIKENLVPFFDLPKQKDGATPEDLQRLVEKSARSAKKNLKDFKTFFLDNFDIDDGIVINGRNNYAFVIESFSDLHFVPVIGLDRSPERNKVVFDDKKAGIIRSDFVALRLLAEDFESFELVEGELADLMKDASSLFEHQVLILDNRVCTNIKVPERANQIVQFITDSAKTFTFFSTIITGSSIPASIKDVLEVESEATHDRKELMIFREAAKELKSSHLFMGDYTIVSPLYSEFTIPPAAMLNVMAPKIIYSFDRLHYVARGGALKSHARGNAQYNDIAKHIVSKALYRGPEYSFGDAFLHEKAQYKGTTVTPSSILKPTINAHITYMVRSFVA